MQQQCIFFEDSNSLLKPINKTEFECPSRSILNIKHNSIDQFLISIYKEQQNTKLWLIKRKGIYHYIKCRYCNASIHLKVSQLGLKILKFSNIHIHQNRKYKNKEQQKILQFISQNQINNSFCQLKKIIINRFKISSRRFYYIKNKHQKLQFFEQSMDRLTKKGYILRINNGLQDQFPQIVMIITPKMKQFYNRWGDLVCLDLTYNLVINKPNNYRQWALAVFCGMDSNCRLVLFGYALMCNENTESFKGLIKQFISIQQKKPTCFITDQQLSMKSAFKQLKQQQIYVGQHLIDSFHILKNIRKRQSKESFQYYRKLIKTSNKQRFTYHYNRLLNSNYNQEVLKSFLSKKNFVCFSQIQEVFFGFNCCSSRSEKINDVIKSFIPRETQFCSIFYKMELIQKHLQKNLNKIQQQKKKFQQLFNDFGIAEVREKVEIKIFQKFIQSYTRGLRLSAQKSQGQYFLIYSEYEKYLVSSQTLNCDCGQSVKSGVPCSHVIKTMKVTNNTKYLQYFNSRWLISNHEAKSVSLGRPRNSRRNILR